MIFRGAKKVVLTSRKGITTGYQALCVRRWQESGVKVLISTADCSTVPGTEKMIAEANALGPVGGIFNLAAVSIFENRPIASTSSIFSFRMIRLLYIGVTRCVR